MVALVVLISVQVARGSEDDEPLRGDPIDPEAALTIDLREDVPALKAQERAGKPVAHMREVSVVSTGQRVPLPRAADGTCRTDVVIGIHGSPPDRAEFDADGRHWTQHNIQQEVGYVVDDRTCELVVTRAAAADRIRRRVLKRAPLDDVLKKYPPPASSPRE